MPDSRGILIAVREARDSTREGTPERAAADAEFFAAFHAYRLIADRV
jgi:hypothetical protein